MPFFIGTCVDTSAGACGVTGVMRLLWFTPALAASRRVADTPAKSMAAEITASSGVLAPGGWMDLDRAACRRCSEHPVANNNNSSMVRRLNAAGRFDKC